MVLEFILPILVEFVKDPIDQYVVMPIRRRISFAFKCDSRVQALRDEVDQLKAKRISLQQSVDDATRSAQDINPNVTEWLSNADRAIGEVEEIAQWKEVAKKKCFVGLCPNFKTRYQLSKNVELKTTEIQKLLNRQGLDPVSFPPLLQQIPRPPPANGKPLSSRVSMLKQIMDALRDVNLNMIGVWGMGGIGKTTLAYEIQATALREKLFETVIVVAVSQTPELRRIQGEIADFLGLKFDAEEITGRASQLYRRLENSNVLIILDDLWKKLDLVAVGIPAPKGCLKIMLTSRKMDLLSGEMGAQRLFPLEALEEAEALSLFMSVAEPNDDLHATATDIAKRCAGLPLLIQIVAAGLKNKESHAWNNTLNQLSSFGDEEIDERVYKVLESSYENLLGEEIKSFFLLCALFGQSNIRIQYLLTYSMGLGLFKRIPTVEDARNRVFTLIDKLKANSLLLDGDMVGYVKMHDVVRDTARNIASRVQHAFFGNGECSSRDWPEKHCTRISLPIDGVDELPLCMNCPEAELFLLFTEDLSLKIPDSFFDGNNKLKVVDFTGVRMMSLPSSTRFLTSLQTLCFHNCRLDNVTVLGELKQLELLSFAGSKIIELPREIEELTRLKLLDLRDCYNLHTIPASVLSKLSKLEELYVLNSFDRWNAKGNVCLEELKNLSGLSTLEIQIPYQKFISAAGFTSFNRLKNFKISIGSVWGWDGQYERSRTLKLKVEAGVDLEDGIGLLLRETEDMYLDGVSGIESILYQGLPKLKHLHVKNDYDIQYLIKATRQASCNAFPVLESLYLNELLSMEKICSNQLGMGSFGELRILNISNCYKMKSVLSFSSAKCLQQLRELKVKGCENMEAVVGDGSEDEHQMNEVIELTQLSSIELRGLPNVIGFCKLKGGTEQMGMLFNTMVSFPNLTSLHVDGCKSLKRIFTASMVPCLRQLKKIEIENCELVEEIILGKKTEEIEGEDSTQTIVFPELESLSLYNLPNLKRFSSYYSIEFLLLRELKIHRCKAMGNFVGRDSSRESDCEEYLFNEMVTFSNLVTLDIHELNFIRYLWDEQFIADDSFFKMKFLYIRHCSKLSVVFPSKICTRFQGVEMLCLSNCDRVEEIYQLVDLKEIINSFSLRDLRIFDLGSLKHIWTKDEEWVGAFSAFQNLLSVAVWDCKDLKYIFPAYVGCCLPQLQRCELNNCKQLEAMIAKKRDEEGVDASFQFPDLRELELESLNKMRSLYEGGGPHTFDCPKLKILNIKDCSNISLEKIISNLEELIIDEEAFHAIRCNDFAVDFCSTVKKVTLCSFNEETSKGIVSGLLSGLNSLEMLELESSKINLLSKMFMSDDSLYQRSIGGEQHHFLRVKHLKLQSIWKLKHITEKDSTFIHILQTLQIEDCCNLKNIAPSSTSLGNVTTLHLTSCENVKNLVTASSAKTMVQLKEMKVEYCESIEEIVAMDADDHTEHEEITFNKLNYLELTNLPNFNGFCSSKYNFGFPLLEKVTIQECSRMNIFCCGDINAPKLRGILFEGEQQWEENLNDTISSQLRTLVGIHLEEGRRFQNAEILETALSSKAILLASQMQFLNKLREIRVRHCDSIQVVFDLEEISAVEGYIGLLPKLNKLKLINLPMLNQLCNKDPKGIMEFRNLKVLKIEKCSRLEYALTWSIASCLSQLERIVVKNCKMMETLIIDGEDAAAKVTFDKLANVVIENMPKFSRIYSGSGDLRCPSLHKVTLRDCPGIKALFISTHVHPAYLHPQALEVESCEAVVGEGIEDEVNHLSSLKAEETTISHRLFSTMVSFPKLTSLEVSGCYSLKHIFTTSVVKCLMQLKELSIDNCESVEEIIQSNEMEETMVFPKLDSLSLENLPNLKRFSSCNSIEFPLLTELKISSCDALYYPQMKKFNFFIEKLIFNFEEITLVEQGFRAIHRTIDGPIELCTKLKKVTMKCFDEETPMTIFSGFLSEIKSLEMLVLRECSLEDIFCERPVGDCQHHCPRVKHLELYSIRKLKHIIKEDSQHLQTLKLILCVDLMSIAPCSTSLENLTTLHLFRCDKMTNLVTASTAKTMVQLMEMKVEFCCMIEEIVAKDADDTEHDEIIFSKLQCLELTSLPNFYSFCSYKHTFCFPLLEKVMIEECSRMKIFCGGAINTPKLQGIQFEDEQHWEGNLNDTVSSQLRTWVGENLQDGRLFQNLESLELVNNMISSKAILANQMPLLNGLRDITVRDCEKIQVVFDLEGDVELPFPELKSLELINLPMLTQLCTKAPKGIWDFKKLEVLKIEKCSRLIYAFTWSMVSCLCQLKMVQVENCEMMETLIVDDEDATTKTIFDKLGSVFLKDMPKFSSIYSGKGHLECPSLNKITIMECPIIKACCSTHQVFSKLEELSIDVKSIRPMMQFEALTHLFSNLKTLEVLHCSAMTRSQVALVHFVSRLPNLDQLKLCDSSFKELFKATSEEALTMPWIKSLMLENLDDLNKIWWHASLFPSLETLELDGCNQLMNMMTLSMARNMSQLKKLKVSNCTMLMGIVGDGIDQATEEEIVFTNLETLMLVGLQSLQAFSLTHYNFKFPCLDQVFLFGCPKLRIFCHGVVKTPVLNCVKKWKNSRTRNWEGDLNTTTEHLYRKMVGFEHAVEIKLSAFPVLKEKWGAQFPISFFSSLQRLEVHNCELFANAVPSHLFQHLKRLKVLIVEKCDSMEQVMDLEGLNAHKYGITRMRNLEEMQLIDLPRLRQVWSKDPHQILSFKSLKILKVDNCGILTFIFNLSIALSLENLQQVEVKNCCLVEHIIMIADEETMQKYETIFPSLQSMTLLHLTRLLSFCSTSGVAELPSLKLVEVVDCPNLELFDSSITSEDPDSVKAFLGNQMVMPGLEELKVEWMTLKDELFGNYQNALFSKLKRIELAGFQGEEFAILPPSFLHQFLKLEKLALSDAFIEEISLDDLSIHIDKDPESVAILTKLKLSKLPNLKHVVRHDCLSIPLFKHLTDLEVVKCDGLINLINSSTARSFVQLRRMSVKDCEMIQEIVAAASDGEEYEIQFSQLEYLELDGLQCLTCFSSGNYNFYFPSMQEVVITECPKMKSFAERVSVTPNLRKIKTGRHVSEWEWESESELESESESESESELELESESESESECELESKWEWEWEWEGSLNDTIQALYMEKDAEEKADQNTSQKLVE